MTRVNQEENGERRLSGAEALRQVLRADLKAAMKARDADAMSVLRTMLAALDNAEAVDASDRNPGTADGPIAGASEGVGSTEVSRRVLSLEDVRSLLEGQIVERATAAVEYERHGREDAAGRLRREADVLRGYLKLMAAG